MVKEYKEMQQQTYLTASEILNTQSLKEQFRKIYLEKRLSLDAIKNHEPQKVLYHLKKAVSTCDDASTYVRGLRVLEDVKHTVLGRFYTVYMDLSLIAEEALKYSKSRAETYVPARANDTFAFQPAQM